MYRDRAGGGGSSKSEIVGEPLDRKRINDALDKHLQKSLPSASRGLNSNSKDKERVSLPSTSTAGGAGKLQQLDRRDTRSSSTPTTKNKCSDDKMSSDAIRDASNSSTDFSDADDDLLDLLMVSELTGYSNIFHEKQQQRTSKLSGYEYTYHLVHGHLETKYDLLRMDTPTFVSLADELKN